MNSKFFKINLSEFTISLYATVLSAVIATVLEIIKTKGTLLFTKNDIMTISTIAVVTGLTVFSQKFLQTNKGEQLGGIVSKIKIKLK